MNDDIIQKLRVTMPDFKGIEISCPCRIRSLLMKEAADEIEKRTRERDEARAEVERLRADHDALRDAAREYLETLGGAMKSGKFEMGGSAEMAHFVRQAMQKLDSLVFDRAGPRPAGLEKLHEPHGRAS